VLLVVESGITHHEVVKVHACCMNQSLVREAARKNMDTFTQVGCYSSYWLLNTCSN
jgi:hypothetical protein